MGQGIFLPIAGQTREVSSVTMGFAGNRNVTGGWIGVASTPRQFWGGKYVRYFSHGYIYDLYYLYYQLPFFYLTKSASSAYPTSKSLYETLSTEFTNYCHTGYTLKDSNTWDTARMGVATKLYHNYNNYETSKGFFLIPILLVNVKKLKFVFEYNGNVFKNVKIGIVTVRHNEYIIRSKTFALENNKCELSFSGNNRADYILFEGTESENVPATGLIPPITEIQFDYEKDYFPKVSSSIFGPYTGGINRPCIHLHYGGRLTRIVTSASSPVFMMVIPNNTSIQESYRQLVSNEIYTVHFLSREPFTITGLIAGTESSVETSYYTPDYYIPGGESDPANYGKYYRITFTLNGSASNPFINSDDINRCYLSKNLDLDAIGKLISGAKNTDYSFYKDWEEYGNDVGGLIPQMTSNTTPKGTVTYSEFQGYNSTTQVSNSQYFAFDRNSNTAVMLPNENTSGYIQYTFDSPVHFERMIISACKISMYSGRDEPFTVEVQYGGQWHTYGSFTITEHNGLNYVYKDYTLYSSISYATTAIRVSNDNVKIYGYNVAIANIQVY